MTRTTPTRWRLDRRINLSVLLQLTVLASLILGSWMNLQLRLDGLRRDVASLLQSHRDLQRKLEQLAERTVAHEYRLQAVEEAHHTRQAP